MEKLCLRDRKVCKGQGEQVISEEGTALTTHIDGLAAYKEALKKLNASGTL